MTRRIHWFTYAAPSRFYDLMGWLVPWCWAACAVLTVAGLYMGFFVAPTDAQQGEAYRIIFIHVPAAWMSMVIYLVMAFWAAVGWMFNARMAAMLARALAPTGAMFTFLALWTGALWGKPTWGAWWVWDARLTSELILLFLYLGYIALVEAIDDPRAPTSAGALLAWWVRQRAHHLFLGALVEHAAPGRLDQHDGRAEDGRNDASAMLLMTFAFWAYSVRGGLHARAGHRLERERAHRLGTRKVGTEPEEQHA
jgi:heme exporter protein C